MGMNYFRRSLERLTGGDKNKSIVFYCDPNCWMSWNAAKRALIELGYGTSTVPGARGLGRRGQAARKRKRLRSERAGLVQ